MPVKKKIRKKTNKKKIREAKQQQEKTIRKNKISLNSSNTHTHILTHLCTSVHEYKIINYDITKHKHPHPHTQQQQQS